MRIFLKECRSLAAAGYDVHLVSVGAPDTVRDGVSVHGVPAQLRGRLHRMTRTVWTVARTAWKLQADVYHFHDPELIPVGLWLRARGRRVVYDIHEDLPRDLLTKPYLGPLRSPLAWPLERLENFAARQFSALITATPAIGARFQPLNPRTVVLNNYPLRDELHRPAPSPWDQRATAVAYTGVISVNRCLMEMVDAMAALPPGLAATLELAGRFAQAADRARATQRPGWPRVRERGLLDRAAMAELLHNVRAGLVLFYPEPNHINAQPNKLFEYMSAGLPLIASDFPLWREQVSAIGCGWLVNPLDPHAIAAAIARALTESEEAAAMGQRGRAAVETQFNWEREARKLVDLYHVLFAGPAA